MVVFEIEEGIEHLNGFVLKRIGYLFRCQFIRSLTKKLFIDNFLVKKTSINNFLIRWDRK